MLKDLLVKEDFFHFVVILMNYFGVQENKEPNFTAQERGQSDKSTSSVCYWILINLNKFSVRLLGQFWQGWFYPTLVLALLNGRLGPCLILIVYPPTRIEFDNGFYKSSSCDAPWLLLQFYLVAGNPRELSVIHIYKMDAEFWLFLGKQIKPSINFKLLLTLSCKDHYTDYR